MALEDIFSLFGFSDDGKEDLKRIEVELDMFKDTPHFKLGMFHKLIMNGNLFSKQVIKFFSKADPGLDANGIDQAGEYMMYTRAWFWIEQVRIRKKEWKEALKQYASEDFAVSVKLSISYFEDIEEYEKCAHLKKIQDFIEKNLPK
jgi:hypothetical protein